jgi:predicted ATPase
LVSLSELSDLGVHRLKDLPDGERIWQLGLGVFPPLRSGREPVGNLPQPARSFVGREAECKRLAAAVGAGRLVTLIGVGGVGKTRLALEVAGGLATDFPDGVWWCDLAPLDDPGSLVGAVAATLTISLQAGLSPTESVVDWLKDRSTLLVFDNCEHLLDGVAALLEAVLGGCPTVALLATSREPMGLEAEQVWPVRSLDPDLEGVELFVERATAADASFTPDDDRAVLVELCRHLDGIPLAIELAAAKVRGMSPAEVLDRLSDRFRLLRGGARRGMDRHRTLAATLDWSYHLLSGQERTLLDRLCVFAGSFDLPAVETVCAGEGFDDLAALDAVTGLVDKSMVVAERRSAGTRYRLLETVRQYAEGHLADRGDLADLRLRHLAYYRAMTESAGASWRADYTSGQVIFDREWDNLRAAVQTALAIGDSRSLGRMFTAIGSSALWSLRYEVGDWAEAAIRLSDPRVATFGMAALSRALLGDYERSEALARAGMDEASGASYAETYNCWIAVYSGLRRSGQLEAALDVLLKVQRSARKAADPWGEASVAAFYAFLAVPTDPAGAARLARRAEELIASSPNPALRSEALHALGLYYSLTGEAARAIECCQEALTLAEEHQVLRCIHRASNALAQIAARARSDDATPALHAAITRTVADRVWYDLWPTMPVLAEWWLASNQADHAAVVIGYLDAHHLPSVDDTTRSQLGTGPDIDRALTRGAHSDRDQLIAYILEHLVTGSEGGP